ncbi:hypothetical protein [Actinomadura sp. 3N407]|uniref:hypothetical protein n=1 Tax=Actinomadura sp. 3N407 TaxID=3457423 RepID=UPI003FCC3AA6
MNTIPRRRPIRAALAISALTTTALTGASAAAASVTGSAPAEPARQAAAAPAAPPLNQPVYIDHVQTGLQLVPDVWNTTGDDEVDGYFLVNDATHERTYRWRIATRGDGYVIRNIASRRCMTADKTDRLTLVYLRPCDEDDGSQRWGFNTTNVPNGSHTIYPLANRTVALAPNSDPWNWPGADWHTRLDNFGPFHNQYWRVRSAPN